MSAVLTIGRCILCDAQCAVADLPGNSRRARAEIDPDADYRVVLCEPCGRTADARAPRTCRCIICRRPVTGQAGIDPFVCIESADGANHIVCDGCAPRSQPYRDAFGLRRYRA